jgi:type IV secretion system protein VirB10
MEFKRVGYVTATMALAAILGLPSLAQAETKLRLAEGTKIVFTLNDTLSTKDNRKGDEFSGVVSRSVRIGEEIAIPEGSVVRGTVTHVKRAGRVKGRSELQLRFDEIELPDGTQLDLSASVTGLDEGEKEGVKEEGEVEGEGTKKQDAAKIGLGAGIGAAIGAIAGGGKGAAIGAGTGAGVGTGAVLLTRGKDVTLKRGSNLIIQLDRPLTVTLP